MIGYPRAWLPVLLFVSLLLPVDNDVCEDCHDDETMQNTRAGITYSLYVTSEFLENTPHEDFDCIDCHTDLEEVEDFPHAEHLNIPDCGECHEDTQVEFLSQFYNHLKEKGYTSIPNCWDCHGKHKISWKGKPKQVCGVCHQNILDEFSHSVHWKSDTGSSDTDVTCVSCHMPHNKEERSSYTHEEWKLHIAENCRECHGDEVENYDASAHFRELQAGNSSAPSCNDCHARHKILSPKDPRSRVSVANLDTTCTSCHTDYEKSIHRPEKVDDPRLETCAVCHTGHNTEMQGDIQSTVFDMHLSQVCLKCHSGNLITGENDAHGGIHRSELEKLSNGESADCGSCHTYHFNTEGHLIKSGIQKSCAECHPEQQAEYEKSIHFIARKNGHKEAPDCMTCHGMGEILKPEEQFVGQNVVNLCGRCHGNREITLKFQLNPEVMEGYSSSYHGQMYQLGYQGEKFATCVSCHDNHSIMSPDNPESTIGQEHIMETCAQCHDNVTPNFVKYLQHYSPMLKEQNPVLNYIHTFMVWLLGIILFIFGGHTLLWFIRLTIRRFTKGPIKKIPKSGKRVKRFGTFERLMHLGMVVSFLTLASTGLPLKYSHSQIANWFVHNVIGFQMAATLHRVAAILLIFIFFIHLYRIFYKAFIQRQKGVFFGPDSLMPNMQDFKDFFNHIAYFIGVKEKEPKFGRWTYWEKFDYFAVFWGMLVIGSSGVTLWFPEFFTQIFPGWLINAAHIIHSEEALLATAFIFTVHFFNTHLRPGAFPMDEVIFTGRVTEEHFNEERPLQRETLSEEEYKALLIDPSPKWLKRLTYLLGYTFLTIGLILLILIIIGSFQ